MADSVDLAMPSRCALGRATRPRSMSAQKKTAALSGDSAAVQLNLVPIATGGVACESGEMQPRQRRALLVIQAHA